MVEMALLIGIIILMSFTPIGYLKIGVFAISFLSIPVAIGAITIGPGAGTLLGLVFGLTSFAQCFGMDAFGVIMLELNPVGTFVTTVVTRTLMGLIVGLIFKGLSRKKKAGLPGFALSAFAAPFFNTVLYMSALVLFFWNTDALQSVNQAGLHPVLFVVTAVGINGICEWIAGTVIGTAVCKALFRAFPERPAFQRA